MKVMVLMLLSLLLLPIAAHAEKEIPVSMAIFDFVDDSGSKNSDAEKISLLIFAQLSMEPRINLIEREKVEKIRQEQVLSESGLVRAESIIKAGKVLGVEYMLSGRIYYLDDEIRFNGKLLDCKTGKISGMTSSCPKSANKDEMLEDFAKKIAKYVSDKITEKQKNKKD
ncbi:MAG: CsgG/HfaB family protein [Victivallales bacterium]|jgi:TolB-like protein